jgi:serine/threonine protein kinase
VNEFYKQNTLPTFVDKQTNIAIPEKIGPYKIETLLSKGGMSLLYLGIHPETKKLLVVKVLSPEYVNHPEMMDHFIWESKIIGLTDHPNIVKLYGQGQWEGGLYIAMEFIQGVSLSQFLMQHSFSLKRSLEIILQVAYALCHLHSHGVIHRDLKPENVLIAEDGEVKVIDFGIAQLHEDFAPYKAQPEKKIMGTPSYMSPEQKEDPLNVTFASDIFSLGIIAYELIIGKLSFGVINLSLLSPHLQKIVGKALAISLKERYHDIVDFITDISHYLKSPDLEKEQSGSDQVKDYMDELQRAGNSLSAPEIPTWPRAEIGLGKHRVQSQMGVYYDFLPFPNNLFGLVLAKTSALGASGYLMTANLRGMIKVLTDDYMTDAKKVFQGAKFVQQLSRLIAADHLAETFHFGLLMLDPFHDSLSFIGCGIGPLLHLPQGSKTIRKLRTKNPLLGVDPSAEFSAAGDNWNDGDVLLFHSLETEENSELEAHLESVAAGNLLLSPMRAAETILKKTAAHPAFDQKKPELLMMLSRLS